MQCLFYTIAIFALGSVFLVFWSAGITTHHTTVPLSAKNLLLVFFLLVKNIQQSTRVDKVESVGNETSLRKLHCSSSLVRQRSVSSFLSSYQVTLVCVFFLLCLLETCISCKKNKKGGRCARKLLVTPVNFCSKLEGKKNLVLW